MSKIRILTIEDDPEISELYRRIFDNSIFSLRTAPNYESARDMWGDDQYNMVFCDQHTVGLMKSADVWNYLISQRIVPDAFFVVTGDRKVRSQPGMSGIIYKPDFSPIFRLANKHGEVPCHRTKFKRVT